MSFFFLEALYKFEKNKFVTKKKFYQIVKNLKKCLGIK